MNKNFRQIFEEFRQKRKKNKDSILTLIYGRLPGGHSERSREKDLAILVEKSTKKLMKYQQLNSEENLKDFAAVKKILISKF